MEIQSFIMKYVIITSINPPTRAVEEIAHYEDRKLIVIGDRKTPSDWHHDGVSYLSVEDQQASGGQLAAILPWNHYARKMLGYLEAVQEGASVIIDTDDDNIPRENWVFPEFENSCEAVTIEGKFLNIYRYFSRQRIWPRGFPLQDVLSSFEDRWEVISARPRRVGIWQGLADDDPDVDAIYRLTIGEPCVFEKKPPVAIHAGKCVPYNSQNTATCRDLFPLLYLPAYVTFRFTDILRGLVAQPYMWKNGYALGFCAAGVYQERNVHNLLRDFESEIPCYLHPYDVISICEKAVSGVGQSPAEYLREAYRLLEKSGHVPAEESEAVEAWLADLERAGCSNS
jgi:hypothetical protein